MFQAEKDMSNVVFQQDSTPHCHVDFRAYVNKDFFAERFRRAAEGDQSATSDRFDTVPLPRVGIRRYSGSQTRSNTAVEVLHVTNAARTEHLLNT